MLERDITYLAGLFEGEGWFGLHKQVIKGKQYINPAISIKMVDQDIIYYVKRLVGHGSVSSTELPSGKTAYIYRTSGIKAVTLMTALKPWMGTRREGQINMVLVAWEQKKSGKINPITYDAA